MNNAQKLARCALYGQLPIVLQLISGLLVMPRMIHFFGDRYYGVWVLLATMLGYFGMLDIGISNSIVRYVSGSTARGDKEESDGWITIGLLLSVILIPVGFVLLSVLVWSCKFFVSEDLDLIRAVFSISGAAFLIILPSRCAIGVLRAHVRADVLSLILSAAAALQIFGLLVALFLEAPFIFFVYIMSGTNLLQGLCMMISAYVIHGGFNIKRTWVTKAHLVTFVDYCMFSFIAQLADLFRFKTYPIIITMFIGLEAVTIFAIANRINMLLVSVHTNVLNNFTAVFSQIEGRSGVGEDLKRAYFFSYKISTYFVSFTIGMTTILAPSFMHCWMGADRNDSVVLLLVALVGSLAAGMQIPIVCFLYGTSKHRFYSISNSIEAGLIFSASVFLVKPYGLIGMVAGASAATLFTKMILQPMWLMRSLNISFWELHAKNTAQNLLRPGVFLLAFWNVSNMFLVPTYLSVAITGMIGTVLYIPYILYTGFSRKQRSQLFASIRTAK
jgi:O-antigen/teichoic acid export membrane protein